MLVSKLFEIFHNNIPRRERAVFEGCWKDEGIWDILGKYDPKSYLISICEPEVIMCSKKLATSLKLNEAQSYLTLRELVRLHEHAHALIHKGDFNKFLNIDLSIGGPCPELEIRPTFKKGYRNLPHEIKEPLTEFVAWSVVNNMDLSFKKAYNEVDKGTPPYYRKWVQLRELIEKRSKLFHRYYFFVPFLIHVARDGVWNDFEHFIEGIKEQFQSNRYSLIETLYEVSS